MVICNNTSILNFENTCADFVLEGSRCKAPWGECIDQRDENGELPLSCITESVAQTPKTKAHTAPKHNRKENKPKPTIAPLDIVLKYDCAAYEEGIRKYYRESWREGFKVSDLVDSCIRHIISFYYDGEDYDKDATVKVHNLASARFCLASILHTLEIRPELDDRSKPGIHTTNEC